MPDKLPIIVPGKGRIPRLGSLAPRLIPFNVGIETLEAIIRAPHSPGAVFIDPGNNDCGTPLNVGNYRQIFEEFNNRYTDPAPVVQPEVVPEISPEPAQIKTEDTAEVAIPPADTLTDVNEAVERDITFDLVEDKLRKLHPTGDIPTITELVRRTISDMDLGVELVEILPDEVVVAFVNDTNTYYLDVKLLPDENSAEPEDEIVPEEPIPVKKQPPANKDSIVIPRVTKDSKKKK